MFKYTNIQYNIQRCHSSAIPNLIVVAGHFKDWFYTESPLNFINFPLIKVDRSKSLSLH